MSLSKQGKDKSRKGFKQVVEGLCEKNVGGFWYLAKNWQKTAQIFTTKVYVIRMNNVHWTSWNSSFYKRQYFLLEKGGKCWYFLMTRQYFEKYKREDTLDMQIWKLLNDAATAARTAAV